MPGTIQSIALITVAVYGIASIVYRLVVWSRLGDLCKDVDELCVLMDGMQTDLAEEKQTSSQPGSEVPHPGDRNPPEIGSWVSQLEGREL